MPSALFWRSSALLPAAARRRGPPACSSHQYARPWIISGCGEAAVGNVAVNGARGNYPRARQLAACFSRRSGAALSRTFFLKRSDAPEEIEENNLQFAFIPAPV